MSVKKCDRKDSQLFVYDLARMTCSDLTIDAMGKFTEAIYSETFLNENNEKVTIKREYEENVVHKIQDNLFDDMHALMNNILLANGIRPSKEWEVELRRKYQDIACGYATALQNDLITCADVFPQTLHCLLHYADDFDHIEKSIRKWKAYNSKLMKAISK
jgi:hypothetical protein